MQVPGTSLALRHKFDENKAVREEPSALSRRGGIRLFLPRRKRSGFPLMERHAPAGREEASRKSLSAPSSRRTTMPIVPRWKRDPLRLYQNRRPGSSDDDPAQTNQIHLIPG